MDTLKDLVALRIATLAFVAREGIPRSKHAFQERLVNAVERIGMATQEVAPLLPRLFEAYQQARLALNELTESRFAAVRDDIQVQLAALFLPQFLAEVPWEWLQHYPRYLAAIVYRIDKLKSGGQVRDHDGFQTIADFWQRYAQQQTTNRERRRHDPSLEEYRWMIEEFRVSLFAQPLGTAIKISPQRLQKQWSQVDCG